MAQFVFHSIIENNDYYLRRRLASGEGIVSLGVCHAVCVCLQRCV